LISLALLHKALESLEEDFSPLYGSLKGTTAVMFCNTANLKQSLLNALVAVAFIAVTSTK